MVKKNPPKAPAKPKKKIKLIKPKAPVKPKKQKTIIWVGYFFKYHRKTLPKRSKLIYFF